MSGDIGDDKKGCKRKRNVANKKWLPDDEAAIINYIKQNPDFEKPSSRIYYDKFLFESGMDADWNRLRAKVRNMRKVYCKAKEYEICNGSSKDLFQDNDETLRSEMLKICWYLDDFDIIFPNDMQTHNNDIYTNTLWTSSDDESSNQDPYSNINNSATTTNFNPKYLPKEPVISLSSNSIKKDILAVQTGMFNFKRQKYDETATIKQQELELLREKFNFDKEKFHFDKEKFDFEKEKFRQEIKIKEKEIESQEKLKIMELQMKERIATNELELKERIALKAVGKHENY